MWLDRVKQACGDDLQITWRDFSLEQVNSKNGPDWKVWEAPNSENSRSFLSLVAGEAARRQGAAAFDKFHLALLKARHGGEGRVSLDDVEALVGLARESGLEEGRFREDLQDPRHVEKIGRDHTEAVEEHGVFGTPTFVFGNGNAAYLKSFIPPAEDSVAFFEHFHALASNRSYVGELKRPQPPWPKGAARS